MRRLFDFFCPNGHVHEDLVEPNLACKLCPTCGEMAWRVIAAPRAQLEGFSGAFPSAADKWEKNRESHMRKEKRNVDRHGTYK